MLPEDNVNSTDMADPALFSDTELLPHCGHLEEATELLESEKGPGTKYFEFSCAVSGAAPSICKPVSNQHNDDELACDDLPISNFYHCLSVAQDGLVDGQLRESRDDVCGSQGRRHGVSQGSLTPSMLAPVQPHQPISSCNQPNYNTHIDKRADEKDRIDQESVSGEPAESSNVAVVVDDFSPAAGKLSGQCDHPAKDWSKEKWDEVLRCYLNISDTLLPLPYLVRPRSKGKGCSRSRGRHRSKVQCWGIVNGIVAALNDCYKHSQGDLSSTRRYERLESLENPYRQSLSLLLCHAKSFAAVRARSVDWCSAQEAAELLLKQPLSGYNVQYNIDNYTPMVGKDVAEPSDCGMGIPLLSVISPMESEYYSSEKRVLEGGGNDPTIKALLERQYGRIGGPRVEYVNYLLRDDVEHLYEYAICENVKCSSGITTVKKTGWPAPGRLRKFLPMCAQGYLFGPPRRAESLGLWGGPTLSRGQVQEKPMRLGNWDLENCFTYLRIPLWMRAYQALPPIRLYELKDKAYRASHLNVSPNTLIYPLYTRLAMGSTHSADVIMSVLRYQFSVAIVRDQMILPSAEMLWINWPTSEETCFVAWEIFCGSAGWSKAMLNVNLQEYIPADFQGRGCDQQTWWMLTPFDLLISDRMNLLDPKVRMFASKVLYAAICLFLHSGSPCSSFSVAHSPAIRSIEFPDGVPWNPPSAQRRCKLGNALLSSTLELENIQYSVGNEGGHENPFSSFQFVHPDVIKFQYNWMLGVLESNYCAYDAPWKKGTGLMTRLEELRGEVDLKCVGGHSHYQLRGKVRNAEGEWIYRTSLAIHYPDKWAAAYARGVTKWAVRELKYRNQRDEGLPKFVKKSSLRRPEDGTAPPFLNVAKSADLSGDDRFLPVDAIQGVAMLNQEHLAGEQLLFAGVRMGLYIHIDDCCLIGSKDAPIVRASEQCVNILRSSGFVIPKILYDNDIKKFVGYTPNPEKAIWQPCGTKAALVDDSILWVLQGRSVVAIVLLKILSHWLWLSLLRRSSLSIPYFIFKFCRKYFYCLEPQFLWPAVRQELKWMRSVLPLLISSSSTPYLKIIGAADAAGYDDDLGFGSYGFGYSIREEGEVTRIGLGSRRVGKEGIRAHEMPLLGNKWAEGNPFMSSIVPPEWIEGSCWQELQAGKFKIPEHIDSYELRAQLKLYELLTRIPECHSKCFLSLCDNSAATSSLERGRSRAIRLNNLCRRRFSLEGATDLKMHVGLIGTKYQPMDSLSRSYF